MFGMLRCFLAIVVVAGHAGLVVGYDSGVPPCMAVEVFFVLSGYFITRTVKRNYLDGYSGFSRFWGNRFLRLYPLYLIALASSLAFEANQIMVWVPNWRTDIHWLSTFLFVGQSGFMFDAMSWMPPVSVAWTLGIEVPFYFVLSAWAARSRDSARLFLAIAVGLSVPGLLIRTEIMFHALVWQALPFALGCFVAHEDLKPLRRGIGIPVLLGLGLYLYAVPASPVTYYVVALLSVPAILACNGLDLNRLRPFDDLCGELSYPIYIIQFPVMVWLVPLPGWTYILGSVVVVPLVGYSLHILVERPLADLRRRIRAGEGISRSIPV